MINLNNYLKSISITESVAINGDTYYNVTQFMFNNDTLLKNWINRKTIREYIRSTRSSNKSYFHKNGSAYIRRDLIVLLIRYFDNLIAIHLDQLVINKLTNGISNLDPLYDVSTQRTERTHPKEEINLNDIILKNVEIEHNDEQRTSRTSQTQTTKPTSLLWRFVEWFENKTRGIL